MGLQDSLPGRFAPILDEANPTIDYWHAKCHEGSLYAWHYENLAPTSGLTTIIHIKTGAKEVHTDIKFEAVGGFLSIQWYGAPTVGTAGTVINCINRNRYYRDTSSLTAMYSGSTVSTVGTVLFGARVVLATSAGANKVTSNIVEGAERILLPNTDYILTTITRSASMAFAIDGLFYEETP